MFALLSKDPMHRSSRQRPLKEHWLGAWVVDMTLFSVGSGNLFRVFATRLMPIERRTFDARGPLAGEWHRVKQPSVDIPYNAVIFC